MAVTLPASGYMENSSRTKGEMKTSLEQLRDAINTIDGEVDQNISDINTLQSQVFALSGIASATETSEGIVELANIAETQTGTDATRAVTPAGLSSRTATETRTGLAELATNSEVQTGTDTSRIVTPAGLSSRTATETRNGIIELATNAETQTGTDTSRAVTPAGLQSKMASDAEAQAGTSTTKIINPATLKSFTDYQVGAWGTPTLTLNGNWSLYSGSSYEALNFRLLDGGRTLEIIGAITSAASGNTNPVGYFSGNLNNLPLNLFIYVPSLVATGSGGLVTQGFFLRFTGTNTYFTCSQTAQNSATCVFNFRTSLDRP